MADRVMICRLIVKEVAAAQRRARDLMPSPCTARTAAACTWISRFSGQDQRLLLGPDDPTTEPTSPRLIGRPARHMPEICAVLNSGSTASSAWCPATRRRSTYSWAHRTARRSSVCPCTFKAGEHLRAELRNPDPGANPYLAFAVMLAAGLEGIETGL